ncbi:Uncharacterised protein [Chromobacterium violaceum]|uniref:Uncharacterized protein n=1 Tax=Chromobacterium violaceum TaxID=536 RepID=A0A3S4HK57_CHRVL|nr:Uncharacterised protein [Chromobacterium violaceum]
MPHSASKQDDSKLLLDNLVELTSQREQEMLESSLLSTLVELMRVDKAELFACRWVNGAPYIRRRLEAQASSGKPVVRETNTDGWLPPPPSCTTCSTASAATTWCSASPAACACRCAAWATSSPWW